MKKYKLGKKEENGLRKVIALKDFGDMKKGDVGGYVEKEDNLSQSGTAWVYDDALVSGNTLVSGYARVYSTARVSGNARVYGNARVSGDAEVSGNAEVSGAARVLSGYINKNFDKKKEQIKRIKYELAKQLGVTTSGNSVRLFKKVNKTDKKDVFRSLHDSNFYYEIGKIARVKNIDMSEASCSTGLHCSTALYWSGGDTLLEVEVKIKDIITIQEGKVRCKALKVIGVVDFD